MSPSELLQSVAGAILDELRAWRLDQVLDAFADLEAAEHRTADKRAFAEGALAVAVEAGALMVGRRDHRDEPTPEEPHAFNDRKAFS